VTEPSEVPDLPDLSGITSPPSRLMGTSRFLLRLWLHRFERHVFGLEHVPRTGPVILAANHMGYLDGPLLFGVAPRKVHALVKEAMFEGFLGQLLRLSGQICIDRWNPDPRAVKTCLRVLSEGGVVAVYPEGARGRGDVAVSKGGAAYLSLVTGAPIVPVACLGTRLDGASTDQMPPRRSRVDTVFGEPVEVDPVPWPRTKQQVSDVNAVVQETLAAHVKAACELTGQSLPALPVTP
jgi:1-acyl-sn-glycerol-3-phosphate acyltransferase